MLTDDDPRNLLKGAWKASYNSVRMALDELSAAINSLTALVKSNEDVVPKVNNGVKEVT